MSTIRSLREVKEILIQGLDTLPSGNRNVFLLLYGRKRGKRSAEDALRMSMTDVIDEMSTKDLEIGLAQVLRTMENITKIGHSNVTIIPNNGTNETNYDTGRQGLLPSEETR